MFNVTVSPVRARPPGVLRRPSGALRATAFTLAVFAALGGLTLSGRAEAGALEQMRGFVASVKSARGDFVQRQIKVEPGKDMRVGAQSSGSFVFARPGKFVWQYLKPYEQVLHADGEKLFIWDKDLDQVTVRKLGDALASSPAAILFGSNDLEKLYTLKESGNRDGIDWLELVPKEKDSQFTRIGVGFRGNAPEAMELRDAFGNTTLLTFSNLERNPALPAQQFRFVIPKGVDVIGQ